MHLQFIESGPALLVENTSRVLVIADLHMGIESALARSGVHIASRGTDRISRMLDCIKESEPDILVLLGDVKHNVPFTTRQEYRELPAALDELRSLVPLKVAPGNHDGGIAQFLDSGELLPSEGGLIDDVGYIHGHTHPAQELFGHLIILGHHHPVVSLQDEVGCALRARPAFLYAGLDEACLGRKDAALSGPTRLLFAPAFNELSGGIDISQIPGSGLGPLSRCVNMDGAEVYLADGTYLGTPGTLEPPVGS